MQKIYPGGPMEILETRDYSAFGFLTYNRDIDPRHVNKLVKSILKCNALKYHPIVVDESFNVLDGQHRLLAAEKLGIPIYYVESKGLGSEYIITSNNNSKHWDPYSHLNCFIKLGKPHYMKLADILGQHKFKISLSSIIRGCGQCVRPHANQQHFRQGTWELQDDKIQDIIKQNDALRTSMDIVSDVCLCAGSWIRSDKVKQGLLQLIRRPGFHIKTFITRLKTRGSSIHNCCNPTDFYIMFKEIYNWRNSDPID
jgi:hypothetical protein